ncbi:MAG: hypothetical protein FWH06_07025 [Oscillospiraceae bacterium]|nr:hypothetical protein [Oscillospiraceae bacterium]
MADKNFQMKNRNGEGWDKLYPRTKMEQVEGLDTKMAEVENVAKGASKAKVFDTIAALDAWLAIPGNKATLSVGDNLYIRDLEVPDYWWDGVAKQPLATEKVALELASASVDGLMAKTDKSKLDGVAANANNYAHPANHPASVITQDASNRFVTDVEKANWNAVPVVTVGAAAPASAKTGDIWYDTSN